MARKSGCARSESSNAFSFGFFGFPLCSWFSSWSTFVSLLWVYGFLLRCWFLSGSTSVSFLWVNVMLMLFRVFAYTVIWKRRGVLHRKGQEGVVAGKSVSYHHHQSAWQRTELRRVYRDTGMMETDWVTEGYGDTGMAEIDRVTGDICSGHPGVDSLHGISYYFISLYKELHILSFPSLDLTCSFHNSLWIHAIEWILTARWYHTFSPSSYAHRTRTALSLIVPLECCERCGGVLMMSFLPSSYTISPQRPWLFKLGWHNWARMEIHFKVIIEPDWMSNWRQLMDGALDTQTLFIG